MLLTEVLEWLNSYLLPYSWFGHWSVIYNDCLYPTTKSRKKKKSRQIFTCESQLTPHTILTCKFTSAFYIPNLGRLNDCEKQDSCYFTPHLQINLTRVISWALLGENQVGHLLAIDCFSDSWWKRLLYTWPFLSTLSIAFPLCWMAGQYFLSFSQC